VFELENSAIQTIVARDSTRPLWSIGLPDDARNPSVAPGDVTAAAVVFRAGRAEVYAPISPGVRQLVITYRLPLSATSVSFPVERDAAVLEVLLEEPRATVEGAGLREVAPAAIEDRQFHRFLSQDVRANAVVRLTLPAPVSRNNSALVVLGVGTAIAMIGALGAWMIRRRRLRPAVSGPAMDAAAATTAERLIAQLATVDARFERERNPAAETRAEYERTRAELKARIAAALAQESNAI
jgi:hypothetical protein